LTRLELYGNHIGAEGATALGAAMQSNTTLTWLGLDGNLIGAEGGTALRVALQHNSTVINLTLGLGVDNSDCIFLCNKIAQNKLLWENQYWSPWLHKDFPDLSHTIIITTLLCNRFKENFPALPALPDHVWYLIFSFWQRINMFGLDGRYF